MIQMKEIKPKEFMRGTKALRWRMYILAGMVGFTAVVSIPTFYLFKKFKGPKILERKRLQEENERRRLETIYQMYEEDSKKNAKSKMGVSG